MADIEYSLLYEKSWWRAVEAIERELGIDRIAWEEMFGGIEDILERTPEICRGRRAQAVVCCTRGTTYLLMRCPPCTSSIAS